MIAFGFGDTLLDFYVQFCFEARCARITATAKRVGFWGRWNMYNNYGVGSAFRQGQGQRVSALRRSAMGAYGKRGRGLDTGDTPYMYNQARQHPSFELWTDIRVGFHLGRAVLNT